MTLRTSAAGGLSRFAHLTGLSRKRADDTPATTDDVEEVKDDVEEVKDDQDDLEDKVEELEDRVEEVEDDQDEDEKDDDELPPEDKPAERAAYLRGRKAGQKSGKKAERARAGAILSAPVAASNLNLALHLAFESPMPAKAAVALLKAGAAGAPKQAARKPNALDARMNGTKPVNVGSGANATGPDMNTASGVAAFALAAAKRAGVIK